MFLGLFVFALAGIVSAQVPDPQTISLNPRHAGAFGAALVLWSVDSYPPLVREADERMYRDKQRL